MSRSRVPVCALVSIALLVAGCGSDDRSPASTGVPGTPIARSTPPSTAPTPDEQADAPFADEKAENHQRPTSPADKVDESIEDTLEQRARAAQDGDRAAVARAQRRLDSLATQRASRPASPPAKDLFERVIQTFSFKTAPLYVQQITSADGGHRLFVSVNKQAFCLQRAEARRRAVETVYTPIDKKLRAAGVRDLDFVLVPLSETQPEVRRALARGRGGRVEMTRGRRGC